MTAQLTYPGPGADWYRQPDEDDLEQGDVLAPFPLMVPGDGGDELLVRDATLVVLTQSCDIAKNAQRSLILAEVHDHERLAQNPAFGHLNSRDYRRALAQGSAVSDFLLPPSPDGRLSWSLVNFRDVFVIPKSQVLDAVAATRILGMSSPYREYLSQAFARFVMRVGLPQTLREFETR